jgi:hypothetical protein
MKGILQVVVAVQRVTPEGNKEVSGLDLTRIIGHACNLLFRITGEIVGR